MRNNDGGEKESGSNISWLAVALILALSVCNLLLITQNFRLRKQLNSAGRIDASANYLKPGETVTPLAGVDLNGRPYQVEYRKDRRRHLLLFFSPSCPYCVRQGPIWRDMLNRIDSTRFNVVGIVGERENKLEVMSHADALGYFKTRIVLPIVSVGDETLARYNLTATPITLLIDDNGRVEHAWVGKWDESKTNEVAAALQ